MSVIQRNFSDELARRSKSGHISFSCPTVKLGLVKTLTPYPLSHLFLNTSVSFLATLSLLIRGPTVIPRCSHLSEQKELLTVCSTYLRSEERRVGKECRVRGLGW